MKKTATYLGLALAVLLVSGAGLAHAYQQGPVWSGQNGNLVDRLVEKFDLSQDEVDEVLGEFRAERREQVKIRQEERLDQLVKDGEITAEQKELLGQKREEHRAQMESLSLEEREEQRDEHREEMKGWMEKNNIDMSNLGQGPRGGMHRGWQGK